MFTRSIYLTKSIRNFDVKSFLIIIVIIAILINHLRLDKKCVQYFSQEKIPSIINSKGYDRNVPLVFINGNLFSGMNLMKEILNEHPLINCKEESSLISKFLSLSPSWYTKDREPMRLENAGITQGIAESAIGAFILEFIGMYNDKAHAKYICNSGNLAVLKSSLFISKLLPNAKFILMIRDPRASLKKMYSSNKSHVKHEDLPWHATMQFRQWNLNIETLYKECLARGSKKCLRVFYEELVMNPARIMKTVLKFINAPWDDSVLNIVKDKEENIVFSNPKLVHLNTWNGFFPINITKDLEKLAPFMKKLGYNMKS